MTVPLSGRIRPNSEAAPWVLEEIKTLEAEVERLRTAINTALTNGHMNALCWATNDDECVGRCRVLRDALKEESDG